MGLFSFFKKSLAQTQTQSSIDPYKDSSTNFIYNLLFCDNLSLYKEKTQQPYTYPFDILFSETSSVADLQKIIDDNNPVSKATKALVNAENTYTQADLDTAKVLINALPDSLEKTDLMNRADNVQKVIDDNHRIIIAADADEVVRTQMDYVISWAE